MTTDRAFIAALQQSTAAWSGVAETASAAEASRAATVGPTTRSDGPHRASRPAADERSGRRAPLSEHLARRRSAQPEATAAKADAATSTAAVPLHPGIEVPVFAWPTAAVRLAEEARQLLLNLLSTATRQDTGSLAPTIAYVGVAPGIGTTTALLATALLIEGVGGKVALLDCSPDCGAAGALGVRRSSRPTGRVDASQIDELVVSSRGGGTSVLPAGPGQPQPFVATAIDRLAATHDLLLIDAGAPTAAAELLGGLDDSPVTALLLDEAGGDAGARGVAHDRLAAIGAPPIGLVETLADRC